jgi:hypothetical protein
MGASTGDAARIGAGDRDNTEHEKRKRPCGAKSERRKNRERKKRKLLR